MYYERFSNKLRHTDARGFVAQQVEHKSEELEESVRVRPNPYDQSRLMWSATGIRGWRVC